MRNSIKRRISPRLRRSAKLARARAFERVGSHRYSQPALAELDKRALAFLPDRPGVFLEIGANDGYSQSNTYYLERVLGWQGILIEPLPELHRICRQLRWSSQCFNVACVRPEDAGRNVELAELDLCSFVLGEESRQEGGVGQPGRLGGGRRVVRAETLSSVIREAGSPRIDFMSIDVEGGEYGVLAGLVERAHLPDWLLLETERPEIMYAEWGAWFVLEEQLTSRDFLFRLSLTG